MANKSKYKGVHFVKYYNKKYAWVAKANINGLTCTKTRKTEREAAIAYDKMLIEHGKEPVNILKRK